jgi:hypothetical protein
VTDRRVLRWEVPVDDSWHGIGGGQVLLVDARPLMPGIATPRLEVWTLEELPPEWPEADPIIPKREVSVFGTGHLLDPQVAQHLGSVIDRGVDGALVWHLFSRRWSGPTVQPW